MRREAVSRSLPFRRAATCLIALLGLIACDPHAASAQRTERFAVSAHAALGFGGEYSRCWEPDEEVGGFFDCDQPRESFSEPLGPTGGLGLRLSFVGWRYVSLGLSGTVRALTARGENARWFTDVGLMVGARYPLELGRDARLVTPYVAVTGGLTTLRQTLAGESRRLGPGYHVGGVAGVEVELVRGFGIYVEAGVTHLHIEEEFVAFSGREFIEANHAVLNLGLRFAR